MNLNREACPDRYKYVLNSKQVTKLQCRAWSDGQRGHRKPRGELKTDIGAVRPAGTDGFRFLVCAFLRYLRYLLFKVRLHPGEILQQKDTTDTKNSVWHGPYSDW